MQEKKDIVDELNRLTNEKESKENAVIRYWAIRWVLKLETQAQYDDYVKGE